MPRYMLQFLVEPDAPASPEDEQARVYRRCEAWFRDNAPVIRAGYHLAPPDSGVMVPHARARDGLVLGGCAVIETDDASAAEAVARAWPGNGAAVEVRQVEG